MKTREDKIYSFFGHLVMTILTLLAIIPILLMFISSLTDNATLLQNGYSFLPEKWSTYAYEWVFTSSSSMVIKAYGMSFILTATGVVCSLALTTCLAYGLSKKGLPGRNVLIPAMVVFTLKIYRKYHTTVLTVHREPRLLFCCTFPARFQSVSPSETNQPFFQCMMRQLPLR